MYTVTIFTISDKGSLGLREDTAGPAVQALVEEAGFAVAGTAILPDEADVILEALIRAADKDHANLVLTVGGTGFSPRDVTPEATAVACEKMVPGIPEYMRMESLKITKRAMLSRAAAGIRGKTLIVNLPGSEKAARENLQAVLGTLSHGLDMLLENRNECADQEDVQKI
jgi:molybdenum cofactor synthesis domain-containing protein